MQHRAYQRGKMIGTPNKSHGVDAARIVQTLRMAGSPPSRIQMSIRPFDIKELRTICRIETESFGAQAWSPEIFREYARRSPDLFLVARIGREIVGYSIAYTERRTAELDSLAVSPKFRRQGVATTLLDATLRKARISGASTAWLMVRSRNKTAISFYRKIGFVRTSTVNKYYEDRWAAWRMRLKLKAYFESSPTFQGKT
jgi:ribosomal-protein-alanine N-acetyltransferase